MRNAWRDNNIKNLYDVLAWYNNLDVAPFQTAIAKYVEFFRLENIDVFKTGISNPGLAIHYSFKFLADNIFFLLFSQKHSAINMLFHLHLVGGPSTVFRRYLEVGVSFLKDVAKKYFVERLLGMMRMPYI